MRDEEQFNCDSQKDRGVILSTYLKEDAIDTGIFNPPLKEGFITDMLQETTVKTGASFQFV